MHCRLISHLWRLSAFSRRLIKHTLVLTALFFLGVTFGCSKKSPPPSKRSLHLNIAQDQIILDPRKGADFSSVSVQFLLFEGLVQMTPYSTRAPAVAEKIAISDDLLKYTFYLREARWSDGTPITAFDFVQTWKDILHSNFPSPNAHLLYPIRNGERAKRGEVSEKEIGIRALDHRTIEVYLEQPTPYFLDMISFAIFHPVNQAVNMRNPRWAEGRPREFVCNGPFRLKEWQRNHTIILEKNPYYWDAANVELDEIHISLISSEQTALQLYEQGELDFLGLPFTGIVSDSVPDLLDRGMIKTTPLPASTICTFNLNSYPFHNKNIRKAFAYAIHREEIVNNITMLGEEIGTRLLPESLGFESEPFFQDGDIEQAREYLEKGLEELGVSKEGLGTIKLLHATTGIYSTVAQALQTQWLNALGIFVQLEGFEYKVFLDKLTKRDYQMGQCIWIAQYLDPMNFFDRFREPETLKNYPGYDNPEYAKILEDSLLIHDQKERFKLLKKAEKLLVEDMPLTPIYHWKNAFLVKNHVKGFAFNRGGGYYFHRISIDESQKNVSVSKNLKF